MMTVDPNQAKSIFLSAVEEHRPEEWGAYLDSACCGDTELRQRVEALLAAHQGEDRLLDDPEAALSGQVGILEVTEGPGTVIGRYRLLEKIGEGGMAVVYMAEQEEPIRRKVALKIIKLGMDTRQVIARFEAERQALALMDHPSIAKVYDAGATETGRPYFVMELVQGVLITEYCDGNSLGTKDRLGLFIQVCNAVQHAHQKGIIHRDIKPSNVMVTHHDGKPVPKVIDFGIAKATNQRLTEKTLFTRYAHLIGTPAYMSPEQAELSDLDIDTRSDIYSLGVLLYELLTGTTPFSEEELRKAGYIEMQRVIREQEPVKPSTKLTTLGDTSIEIAKRRSSTPELLRKTLRGDLDWIVMKSLEKDRTHRYETPNGLAEDLRRHLEHEPVLARGPNTIYRLQKVFRRHRAQVLAAAMIAVVVVATGVILSLWNRDRQRLDRVREFQDRVILSQAREQHAKGDRQAALKTITPVLSSRHVGSEAQLLYAGILVDGGLPDQARAMLKQLISDRPEIAGAAHALLAKLLLENEALDAQKLKETEEHRRQAEVLLPETAEAYFLRAMTAITVKEQLTWLDEALQVDPRHYDSRRLRALAYEASRKYEKMEHDALVMTVLNEGDPLGYSLRAMAWRELGRYPEAMTEYGRALDLMSEDNPQYIDLCIQRCETFMRMGDYEHAVSESQAYSQLWPDRPVFQHLIFCALTTLGDYTRAITVFEEMVRPDQRNRRQFKNWCAKYVFQTLETGRSWHPPDREPVGAAFLPLVEAEEIYRKLSTRGHRVAAGGFNAQWSPDGKKLVFSLGIEGDSGVAVFDPATNQTDLLIIPGKYPKWSPDGRYIVFARDLEFLRVPELLSPNPENRPRPGADEEIWLMKSDGTEPRRLACGVGPTWGRDSSCVYYRVREDNTLCSISITDENTVPKRVMMCPGYFPSLSPDNQRVAYLEGAFLEVKDVASQTVVAQWPLPWSSTFGLGAPSWSPDGQELCLGGSNSIEDRTGLWVYRLGQSEPSQLLDGPTSFASWAADGTKLVLELGEPHFEIWTMDCDPNVPTVEALGPARTAEQYLRETIAFCTRRIEADPRDAYAYESRARCYDSLQEREEAAADMYRWSAIMSGKSPSDLAPPDEGFTFGEPVNLDTAIPFLADSIVECFSSDGREMFVCSWRSGGSGGTDIWALKRASADDDWGPPENLGPAVNSANTDAASSISADGLELYFNSSRAGGYDYDLYVTKRASVEDDWGPPIHLGPPLNSAYLEAFPSVSADGLELYFMSNRPGGYGGYDLYVSKRATTKDSWGPPTNLGPAVNTLAKETAPCLSPDGLSLFFQDYDFLRPGGYGGGDLWVSRRASRSDPWEPAVSLGPIIDGPTMELRPCLVPDGSALYFARQSGGVLTHWKAPIIRTVDSDLNDKAKEKED